MLFMNFYKNSCFLQNRRNLYFILNCTINNMDNPIHMNNLSLLKQLSNNIHTSDKVNKSRTPSSEDEEIRAMQDPGSFKDSAKVFLQTLNPSLCRMEWKVQEEDYDYTQEVARSAYADMLHDDERNQLYYRGLQSAIAAVRDRGDVVHVLDIGTGTGLLSMMAVACGADTVTACEAFEPMAVCAEKILASNNMANKVRVVYKRSTELRVGPGLDMEQRANVLVAEVFDTELIGEGAISTYHHAKMHLLTANALLVPSAARVYAQVVSSPQLHAFTTPRLAGPDRFMSWPPAPRPHGHTNNSLRQHCDPYAHIDNCTSTDTNRCTSTHVDNCIKSPENTNLKKTALENDASQSSSSELHNLQHLQMPESIKNCPGSMNVHDLQMSQIPREWITPVSEILTVFEFDWSGRNIELTFEETTNITFTPILNDKTEKLVSEERTEQREESHQIRQNQLEKKNDIDCHAVLMWWDLTMDQEGDVVLTCAPYWHQKNATSANNVPWRDHWMQAVYKLPPPLISLSSNHNSTNSVCNRTSSHTKCTTNATTTIPSTPSPTTKITSSPSAHCEVTGRTTPENVSNSVDSSANKLTLTAARDEYSMWFSLTRGENAAPRPSAPHCLCGLHVMAPRTRIAQLSDATRLTALASSVSHTLREQRKRQSQEGCTATAWLLLGDGVNPLIVSTIAASDGVSHVYVQERSRHGRRMLREVVLANGGQALWSKITLLPEHVVNVTSENIKHQIGVVFSEPHFHTSLLPWHNIAVNGVLKQHQHLLPPPTKQQQTQEPDQNQQSDASDQEEQHDLVKNPAVDHTTSVSEPTSDSLSSSSPISNHSSPTLSPSSPTLSLNSPTFNATPPPPPTQLTSAIVLPGFMEVYAMPVCFRDLWKIRAPCKHRCGFDLTLFDELIDKARCQSDDYMEAQPLWEYPCIALLRPVHLLTVDLSVDLSEVSLERSGSVEIRLTANDTEVAFNEKNSMETNGVGLTKSDGKLTCNGSSSMDPNGDGLTKSDGKLTCNGNISMDPNGDDLVSIGQSNEFKLKNSGKYDEVASSPRDEDGFHQQELYYNGVVVWTDWRFGPYTVSTGPVRSVVIGEQVSWNVTCQQGVHLPRQRIRLLDAKDNHCAVAEGNTGTSQPLHFTYTAALRQGELTFKFDCPSDSTNDEL